MENGVENPKPKITTETKIIINKVPLQHIITNPSFQASISNTVAKAHKTNILAYQFAKALSIHSYNQAGNTEEQRVHNASLPRFDSKRVVMRAIFTAVQKASKKASSSSEIYDPLFTS